MKCRSQLCRRSRSAIVTLNSRQTAWILVNHLVHLRLLCRLSGLEYRGLGVKLRNKIIAHRAVLLGALSVAELLERITISYHR